MNRWLKRELIALSGEPKFSLRRYAALAQNDNPRLAAPLFLYCRETDSIETLYGFMYDSNLLEQYRVIEQILKEINLTEAALTENIPDALPREYAKHLASFAAAYRAPETEAESKKLRWERSRALQLEKGIPTAWIYNKLGLNPGNVNAYMKHGDTSKVSLDAATSIMKYLMNA